MAQISIIADDKMVVKDGVGINGLTLSDVPADVWAVQWDTTTSKGHIEKKDMSIEEITSIGIYQSCIDEYTTEANKTPTPEPQTETDFKNNRTQLLYDSDWTQGADSPLSDAKKAEWATYRQALRDLPTSTTDYDNVNYPTQPS